MECPYCGSIDNKVIDSRMTKERFSIRRRRICSACLERFTTYESTENRLLSVLIRKKTGMGATATQFRTTLSFLSDTLSALSGEAKTLADKIERLAKDQADRVSKSKVAPRLAPKKKAPAKKPAARRARDLTATSTVIKIIKRHKKGVGISKLRDRTGFDDKKIRNIVHRASKQGKIKRKSRGIYIAE